MTFFRPSRSDDHLSNYWNALVRNAPAEELARLARLVEPSEIAAIERARAAHERHEPDATFARRLERTLMNTSISPIAVTIPQPGASPPSRNGSRDPGSLPHSGASGPRRRVGWAFSPALGIGLAILLILGSLGGAWLTTNRHDEPHRLMAPLVATPSPDAESGWSHFKGDAARSGETNSGPVDQPAELWRYQAGDACNPSPAAVGDSIYVACDDGLLTALDADTGTIRWQFSAEPFVNGPSVADGVAYVVGGSGTLYAVDTSTGTELWRAEDHRFANSPAVAGDTLVATTEDGAMVGIDTASGTERWRTPGVDGTRSPALAGGVAYAGGESGGMVAIDAGTGEVVWRAGTDSPSTGTAVVADGIAYIGALDNNQGSLNAYDAVTGELLWTRDEPIYSPAVANGVGYTTTADGIVSAFDTATGEERWRSEVGGIVRPVIIAGDILYVPSDGERTIYAFDAQSGDMLWSIAVDGGIWNGPAVTDGRIFVTTTFGVVQAFGESDAGVGIASPEATPGGDLTATPEGSPGATPAAATDTPVVFMWQSSGGPDPLLVPTGMAVAPDGTIWVVDSGNNQFQIFSPDGAYLETWGTPGDGEGEFNFSPVPDNPGESLGGIAFAEDGSFYVGDTANHRVQKFDADRTFLLSWGTEGEGEGEFLLPFWPAIAPDGNVYVSDLARHDVQVFNSDGEYLYQLAGLGDGDHQLTTGGALAIADDGTAHVIDFVRGTIKMFAADGTYIDSWGAFGGAEGEFRGPSSVAIDASGNFYVTDTENGRVQVFTPDREFAAQWSQADAAGTPFVVPIVVTIDDAGGVYVTDLGLGTVQKFEVTVPAVPGATPVATPVS